MKAKWEQFSEEELKEMILSSLSYQDWGRKMGYKVFRASIAQKMFIQYPNLEILAKEKFNRMKDLTGQRFGRLVVIEYSEEFSRKKREEGDNEGRYWKCQCDCGNIHYVNTKRLNSGNTRSCGCLEYENRIKNTQKGTEKIKVDLTGQKFGLLTVLREATKEEVENRIRKSKVIYWFCQCDCGNNHIVATSDLKSNKVQSCGCLISKGEQKIEKILIENNISFKKQYFFNDLKGESGRYYFFDFAIFENNKLSHLIEYDGIQHFSLKDQFTKDSNSFYKNQKRDTEKNNYVIKNNIPLIRIPYTHFNQLSLNDLELKTTTFLYKKGE